MKRVLIAVIAVLAIAFSGSALAAGSPAAGKKVWNANGCGSCHTFKAAGSKGKVGPAVTKKILAADAKRAKVKKLTTFIRLSIVKPDAYVAKGYRKGLMPAYAKLTKKQLNDLVAFIAKG